MNAIDFGKICRQYEYCTDCPVRKECPSRVNFYKSDQEFLKNVFLTNLIGLSHSIYRGIDVNSSMIAMDNFTNAINKKRQRERELHPQYSPE